MYYVVYLIDPELHAVAPQDWVYDPDGEIWTKFVNTGLNSSQTYKCYWKSTNITLDQFVSGTPNPNIVPNFDEPNFAAPRATVFPCDEGTYACKVVRFEKHYGLAREYRQRRRNVEPVIYNEQRILQEPIPIATFNEYGENDDQVNQNDFDEISIPNEDGFMYESDEQQQNGGVFDALDEFLLDNEGGSNWEPNEPFIGEHAALINAETPAVNEACAVFEMFEDVPMDVIKEEVLVSCAGLNEIDDILSHVNGPAISPNAQVNESYERNSDANGSGNSENLIEDVHSSSGVWTVKVEKSLPSSQAAPITSASTACQPNKSHMTSSQAEPSPSVEIAMNSNDEEVPAIHFASASTVATATKPNDDQIEHVCSAHSDDEEISMSIIGSKFPQPMLLDPVPPSFVKHENDPISGDKRYEEDKGARKYYTGQSFVTITKPVVDAMLLWTTSPYCTQKSVDEQVIRLLLVCCIPEPRLQMGQVEEAEMTFIEDLFRIRTKNDEKRLACFQKYVKNYLKMRAVA